MLRIFNTSFDYRSLAATLRRMIFSVRRSITVQAAILRRILNHAKYTEIFANSVVWWKPKTKELLSMR